MEFCVRQELFILLENGGTIERSGVAAVISERIILALGQRVCEPLARLNKKGLATRSLSRLAAAKGRVSGVIPLFYSHACARE